MPKKVIWKDTPTADSSRLIWVPPPTEPPEEPSQRSCSTLLPSPLPDARLASPASTDQLATEPWASVPMSALHWLEEMSAKGALMTTDRGVGVLASTEMVAMPWRIC